MQAISANHIAEFETDSESEHEDYQEQLDMDILLNMESDNECLNFPLEVYSVPISKFHTAADFFHQNSGIQNREFVQYRSPSILHILLCKAVVSMLYTFFVLYGGYNYCLILELHYTTAHLWVPYSKN